LARAKLLQIVANELQIPQKYLIVPSRFYGGTAEFKEPEISRTLRSLVADDVNLIDDLLRNLTAHIYRIQPDQVKAKLDASLFIPFAELVHMHERHAKKENKSKKGKTSLSYTTIKATKPSTLATVAPWEKDAVSEMYDTSWTDLHKLEEEYKRTPSLEIKYNEVSHKLTSIIERQWFDKQTVLRKTNQRLAMAPKEETLPWKKLNLVKNILTEIKTVEAIPVDDRRILNPYALLPTGNVSLPDGFTLTYSSAFKEGLLDDRYPAMASLLATFELMTTPVGDKVVSG
jgi:hypothetical protein